MIQIKFEGLDDIEQFVMTAIRAELQENIGSVRHPVTGEFPSVSITAGEDGNLNIQVEGSPELVALVQSRLNEDDASAQHSASPDEPLGTEQASILSVESAPAPAAEKPPHVFLS